MKKKHIALIGILATLNHATAGVTTIKNSKESSAVAAYTLNYRAFTEKVLIPRCEISKDGVSRKYILPTEITATNGGYIDYNDAEAPRLILTKSSGSVSGIIKCSNKGYEDYMYVRPHVLLKKTDQYFGLIYSGDMEGTTVVFDYIAPYNRFPNSSEYLTIQYVDNAVLASGETKRILWTTGGNKYATTRITTDIAKESVVCVNENGIDAGEYVMGPGSSITCTNRMTTRGSVKGVLSIAVSVM